MDDLVNDLIALIPEDGSRISNDQIRAALEQETGEALSDGDLEELKARVVAMGAAERARGPGGGLKANGVTATPRAAAALSGGGDGHGADGSEVLDGSLVAGRSDGMGLRPAGLAIGPQPTGRRCRHHRGRYRRRDRPGPPTRPDRFCPRRVCCPACQRFPHRTGRDPGRAGSLNTPRSVLLPSTSVASIPA